MDIKDFNDLNKKLSLWIQELHEEDRGLLLARLSSLKSAFPFNEYEYRLMFLLNKGVITFNEYENLRSNYVLENPYLELYGIAPRTFGETWGHPHIIDIDGRFKKPSTAIDPNYDGEYDLCLLVNEEFFKIEAKASRARDKEKKGTLEEKAISSASKKRFWMNFQQLKSDIADVFIFIGVWTDKILYWLLTEDEMKNHPLLSHQHRFGKEYQIGITDRNIDKIFKKYLVEPDKIVDTILNKTLKNKQ